MGKYDLLWDYVKNSEKDSLKLAFKEIEGILGMPIDHSFLKYKKELWSYLIPKFLCFL